MPSIPHPSFARGAYGDLVATLQRALAQRGLYTGAVDNDFGGGTERAVRLYQQGAGRAITGRVDATDWAGISGIGWPSLFERCLQVVARFEGHGYTMVAGNFDGAGLTWGIVGFTLKHGEVQRLLREVQLRDAALLDAAFGPLAAELRHCISQPDGGAVQNQWADAISTGPGQASVLPAWREGFRQLGQAPLVRLLQREAAHRRYYLPAELSATRLGLSGDLGQLLAFDIQIQNGGIKPEAEKAFQAQAGACAEPPSHRARRESLAGCVAHSAKAAWRADVLARKSCVACGAGTVHGVHFDLQAWGLDAG